MHLDSPLDPLASSMYHALRVGLRPFKWQPTSSTLVEGKMVTKNAGEPKEHRPAASQVEFFMFPQQWGSTALGFGGLGGAAMSTAYTVVALGPDGDVCVYFNGGYAYHVAQPNAAFSDDLAKRQIADTQTAIFRYKAVPAGPHNR